MSLRKFIFWLHLIAGTSAGLVIFTMSATGVLLMYERQIVAWADGDMRVAVPSPDRRRLPIETLVDRAREARPALEVSAVTLRADPREPVVVGLGREGRLFIDPYSGAILGEGSKAARSFFTMLTSWHRWLGAQGDLRATGKGVTAAANLVFFFIVITGVVIWWPRNWTRPSLRAVTWFTRGLKGKPRDFNWHNTIGFWSAVPLVLIVGSSVCISYPWAGDLLYRVTGSEPPSRRPGPTSERPRPAEGGRRSAPPLDVEGVGHLFARAERQVEGWKSINLRLPSSPDGPWTFAIDRGDGPRPDLRAQLTLDPRTGDVVSFEPYSAQSAGRKLRSWVRWVHTGEAGGFLGQSIAGIASGGATVLVWTGLALAWRRCRAWLARRAEVPTTVDRRPAAGVADRIEQA